MAPRDHSKKGVKGTAEPFVNGTAGPFDTVMDITLSKATDDGYSLWLVTHYRANELRRKALRRARNKRYRDTLKLRMKGGD